MEIIILKTGGSKRKIDYKEQDSKKVVMKRRKYVLKEEVKEWYKKVTGNVKIKYRCKKC